MYPPGGPLDSPGGLLLTCLNAPDAPGSWLEEVVRREIPGLELVERIDKGSDFPEADPSRREIALLWTRPESRKRHLT